MTRRIAVLTAIVLGIALPGNLAPTHAQDTEKRQPVYLRVLVPHARAQLKIDDRPTRQSGMRREFVSPPLEPGRSYSYTLTVSWAPNNYTNITRSRKVPVQAGKEIEVDLREADDRNPDKIQVRYVPTPKEVVQAMCKLAGVGREDVVYDLGCGDGRIVIAAVEEFRAKRGVGVDIDPARIKESRANARARGLEDRLEFRRGDVLDIKDLGDATVVMLYMGDDLNLLLRPILQKTLKPGSRIVSHRFAMGDWKPDQTKTVIDGFGGEYDIHLWKIGKDDGKKDEE